MKILCETSIHNRITYSSINRRQKSTLAIGLHPPSTQNAEPFILLFTTANKVGTRYKLRQNIEKVFTKFMVEGKATISFKEPMHDLQVKSDPVQMKCFLKVLKLALDGKYDQSKLGLTSVAATPIPPNSHPVIKMIITRRGDYPVKGLPRTLKILEITGIQRSKFDSQILFLKNLQVLSLKDNDIAQIPKQFGQLQLVEVDFSNNKLGNSVNIKDWEWLSGTPLKNSLQSLNLSKNNLMYFPYYLVRLAKLVTLRIDYNEITKIPFAIRRLKFLKYFYLNNNKLQSLPSTLKEMSFELVDISGNEFLSGNTTPKIDTVAEFRLLDFAVQAIVKNKIRCTPEMIPLFLIDMMAEAPVCSCGRLCINSFRGKSLLDSQSCLTSEVFHAKNIIGINNTALMLEWVFCSVRCVRLYSRFLNR